VSLGVVYSFLFESVFLIPEVSVADINENKYFFQHLPALFFYLVR